EFRERGKLRRAEARRGAEALTAVNDAVHGRRDLRVREPPEHELGRRGEGSDGGGEGRHRRRGHEPEGSRAVGPVDKGAALEAPRSALPGVVEKIELERRAAGVEDEEQHQRCTSRRSVARSRYAPSRIAALTSPKPSDTRCSGITAMAARMASMPAMAI